MTVEKGLGYAPLKVEGGMIMIGYPHLQDFINQNPNGPVQQDIKRILESQARDLSYYEKHWVVRWATKLRLME